MLLAFGSNGSGQLGIGHEDDVSAPTRALLSRVHLEAPNIKTVAAGGNHTLLLSSDGEVFVSGDNSDGRCAQSTEEDLQSDIKFLTFYLPQQQVQELYDFCAATWEASILVTKSGNVFSCGTGHKGELGQGEDAVQSKELRPIHGFPPTGTSVIDLAASMSHVVAVLSNGDVYGWGGGRKGQLGTKQNIIWTPRKIGGIPFKATRAVCGREFTLVAGLPSEGQLAVLGADKWSVVSHTPPEIPGWKDIRASWSSIYVLLESGKLLAWGRDDHGQLCPPGLPQIKEVAVGSEHVVALTASGKILAWGWGEHGNCGEQTDANGDVKGKWNEIPIPGQAIAIGAGCATSFIEVEPNLT
ncbi:alpha-tubulin suppressor protein Aats1 [Aulographum hederae CBS 113979]|uniref:Alpha-tubulin suppressor protein Aats1 n=1 Tax=Aulographum hederae CBS 113979 TaxID=1176131 RepID=A0A6G1GNA8_9PEZI|nr:alpha-tubulin suppressor protein Aats1 [Aulographum hederae CBS 113979]